MMKRPLPLTLCLILIASLLSFKHQSESNFIGTYGVSESDPSKISLTINDDHTFSYTDHSNSSSHIEAIGTWEMKRDRIILNSANAGGTFHTKWKISQDGLVAKSRKGLCFYTLRKK